MKVCLVAVSSLRVAPYVNKYDELLKKNGIECDIISKEHEEAPMGKTEREILKSTRFMNMI